MEQPSEPTAYEPGSTMKVLALAAAINEGVFDPNERYQSGSVKIYTDLVGIIIK